MTKNEQITVADSIHVAHEIEHLILCSKGHKVLLNTIDNSARHKNINDMIYDPLLNKTLIKYDFDLQSYLNLSDEIQMESISKHEDLFLAMTLYVKRTLDYRNLEPNIKPEEIKFNQWILMKYPQIVPYSKEVLRIIEFNGYGTPAETESSLRNIVGFLNLNYNLVNI